MAYVALASLVLALLASLGRKPLISRAHWRLATLLLAAASAVTAVVEAGKGAWIDSAILALAAAWLGLSARAPKAPAPAPAAMGVAEAQAMLGVAPGAGRAEIEAAYRRLMLRVHPDQGGAPGLAIQLNAARERLLGSAADQRRA